MVDKQPIIQNLQKKADEAKHKAHWWDNASWVGFLAWIGVDLVAKPSTTRSIASWTGMIGVFMANMWAASWRHRGDAFQESVNEVKNAPETPTASNQTDWQQKITTQDVASATIGR